MLGCVAVWWTYVCGFGITLECLYNNDCTATMIWSKHILLPLTAFLVSEVMKSATSEYKPRSRMEDMHEGHLRVPCSCDNHKHFQFLLNSASPPIRWLPGADQVQDYSFRVCTDRSANQVWTPLGSIHDPRLGISFKRFLNSDTFFTSISDIVPVRASTPRRFYWC